MFAVPKAGTSSTTQDGRAVSHPQAWSLEALGSVHFVHRALSAEERAPGLIHGE